MVQIIAWYAIHESDVGETQDIGFIRGTEVISAQRPLLSARIDQAARKSSQWPGFSTQVFKWCNQFSTESSSSAPKTLWKLLAAAR